MTIAERLARIEAILQANEMHEPDCPANHACSGHANAAVYHHPRPCICWLAPELKQEDE